jgi:hypothetical protein
MVEETWVHALFPSRTRDMTTSQHFTLSTLFVGLIALLSFGCAPKRLVEPSQVTVSFYGTPQFMPILGSPVTYAANATREIIHDGNLYYLRIRVSQSETEDAYYQDFWFSSANVEGPWQSVHAVPNEVTQVECAELVPYNPVRTDQLCTIPFPHPEFKLDNPDKDFACKLPPCP